MGVLQWYIKECHGKIDQNKPIFVLLQLQNCKLQIEILRLKNTARAWERVEILNECREFPVLHACAMGDISYFHFHYTLTTFTRSKMDLNGYI